MSPPSPNFLFTLTQTTKSSGDEFNYKTLLAGAPRRPGAFRVVEVAGLLNTPQEINLYEYSNIWWGNNHNYGLQDVNSWSSTKYAAISHVWSYGTDVNNQLNDLTNADSSAKLLVDVDGKAKGTVDQQKLTWNGLRQVANAAKSKYLKLKYIWLDLLCLDQITKLDMAKRNDKEKGLQICMMADIYRNADSVITMIGGIPAVTWIDEATGWMDRAWTLQEAVLNPRIYIYVKVDKNQGHVHKYGPSSTDFWHFRRVAAEDGYQTDANLYLVTLSDLLDLADAQPYPWYDISRAVMVLNGEKSNPSDSPRRALRIALSKKPGIKYTGVWRSMFMRTSTHPVDVAYSIMGIFSLQIDPYRKNREPEFLFNDLARKAAARWRVGPVWLTIGGLIGSNIPRSVDSQIVFNFPHIEGAGEDSDDTPPEMNFIEFNCEWPDWVGYHVDDSQYYIKRYDIRFLTQVSTTDFIYPHTTFGVSHPHIINATMLPINLTSGGMRRFPRPGGKHMWRKTARLTIGTMNGYCIYLGDLDMSNPIPRQIQACYVGQVGDMTDDDWSLSLNPISGLPDITGWRYFLFLEYLEEAWKVVADGVFRPYGGFRVSPGSRSIFTVGSGAQSTIAKWPAGGRDSLDVIRGYPNQTYGIEPLRDWRVTKQQQRYLKWYGYKNYSISNNWRSARVKVKITDLLGKANENKLANRLQDTLGLHLVATEAPRGSAPNTARSATPYEIFDEGNMRVSLSYYGWTKSECANLSRAGVEGILIPTGSGGKPVIKYYVSMAFGEQVMYLQMKTHRNTPWYYWQMYVIPYGYLSNKVPDVINSAFITSPSTLQVPPGLEFSPNQPPPNFAIQQPYQQPFQQPYVPYGYGWGAGPAQPRFDPYWTGQAAAPMIPQQIGPTPQKIADQQQAALQVRAAALTAQLVAKDAAERATWGRGMGGGCPW